MTNRFKLRLFTGSPPRRCDIILMAAQLRMRGLSCWGWWFVCLKLSWKQMSYACHTNVIYISLYNIIYIYIYPVSLWCIKFRMMLMIWSRSCSELSSLGEGLNETHPGSVWVIHESWPQDQLDHYAKEQGDSTDRKARSTFWWDEFGLMVGFK